MKIIGIRNFKKGALFGCILTALTAVAGCSLALKPENKTDSKVESFFIREAKWKNPSIPVCWDNATSKNKTERGWVRDAVEKAYEGQVEFYLDFVGWEQCASSSERGIHIIAKDDHSRVEALGNELDGMKNGIILNFTFRNWNEPCALEERRQGCVRGLAVHEFGHAIGLLHEQDRSDRSSSCKEETGPDEGEKHGKWDLFSVMNYCNPRYNNDAKLSPGDKAGIAQLYKSRPRPALTALFCPDKSKAESVNEAGGQFCTEDGQAVGPFPTGLVDLCVKEGGGIPECNSLTIDKEFVRSLWEDSACPVGSELDGVSGYCREKDEAFGPFEKSLVEKCVTEGGGETECKSVRWSFDFLKGLLP